MTRDAQDMMARKSFRDNYVSDYERILQEAKKGGELDGLEFFLYTYWLLRTMLGDKVTIEHDHTKVSIAYVDDDILNKAWKLEPRRGFEND